jgi:hypothetical protein
MWNSGVIGLAHSNVHIAEKVLALTDQLYDKVQVFTAEQFSFSFLMDKYTRVSDSEDYITHYWQENKKYTFNGRLAAFFTQHKDLSFRDLAKEASLLAAQFETLPWQQKPQPPLMDRLRKRVELIATVARQGHL